MKKKKSGKSNENSTSKKNSVAAKNATTDKSDKIIIYTDDKGNTELRADLEKETLRARQEHIANLFDTSKQVISWHLSNIYDEEELDSQATVKEYLTVARNGKKYKYKYFNLDAIIAVGYRVNSKKATKFRIWATRILREYVVRGYNLNQQIISKSSEKLQGLREAIALIESTDNPGKLKGKIIVKLTKNLESK